MSQSNEELEQTVQKSSSRHMPWCLVAIGEACNCGAADADLALTELAARLRRAEEALKPFAHFAEQFDRMPMLGLSDSIYGIHFGTEYEAEIKLSDCRAARAALQNEEG